MVGIKGVGGIPEPTPERPAHVRGRKGERAQGGEKVQDEVKISSESQEAANVSRLLQIAKSETDVRAERVAEAKESIERGDFKRPEIVAKVAERISNLLQ